MGEFRVGDKVRIITTNVDGWKDCIGKKGILKEFSSNYWHFEWTEGIQGCYEDSELELISRSPQEDKTEAVGQEVSYSAFTDNPNHASYIEEPGRIFDDSGWDIEQINKVKGLNTMSVVDKLKNIALSSDERLLRKYEIVDDCGNLTSMGKQILVDILFVDYRETLVAKVMELDKEEKKAKK